MSAAMDLLSELRDRGARVWADGDRVLISPGRVLDPDLRQRIIQAKPQVLALLRAAPPDLALSDRGRAALGGNAPAEPAREYVTPSSSEDRKALLDRFLRDERVPFATFEGPTGAFLIVRDQRALETLDQEHAVLPVLTFEEIERHAAKTSRVGLRAGLLALLAAREVYGAAVELRRVTRTQADG